MVLQCVGYGDSNTFLPVLRANRLARRGFVVIGKDYAGMGRSDGLHAYVPCFPTLVQVGFWFGLGVRLASLSFGTVFNDTHVPSQPNPTHNRTCGTSSRPRSRRTRPTAAFLCLCSASLWAGRWRYSLG